MGMNIGSSGGSGESEPMMEMNMTPLINVMLVLIITIPIQNHAVNLNMPAPSVAAASAPPVVETIDVTADGSWLWNGTVVPDRTTLEVRLQEVAAMPNQSEVHLRPNKLVPYKSVAAVLASAQRLGVTKIGIVGNEQFIN